MLPSYSLSQSSMAKGLNAAIYTSPELMKEEKYDNKADVYSFGVLLYHIFVGKLPKYTIKDKLNQKEFPLPLPSSEISQFCIDLISCCTSFDPKNRPSFDEILKRMKSNSFMLASDVDVKYVSQCDEELRLNDS